MNIRLRLANSILCAVILGVHVHAQGGVFSEAQKQDWISQLSAACQDSIVRGGTTDLDEKQRKAICDCTAVNHVDMANLKKVPNEANGQLEWIRENLYEQSPPAGKRARVIKRDPYDIAADFDIFLSKVCEERCREFTCPTDGGVCTCTPGFHFQRPKSEAPAPGGSSKPQHQKKRAS
ncbi:MAG: hypothetical protein AB7G93_01395 [Bdellovibrionales bacterium]